MMQTCRFVRSLVGSLLLALIAASAHAQVPQDTTFTGRLVDDQGTPLTGPVNLELRVFDVQAGSTALYTEEHNGTALDATGGFSLQLGLGTSPSGTFDAGLFADTNRWLEVVVDTEVLTPRQIFGSVPWALIAQQANEIVPDPNAPRLEDCGDGTVADRQTGLQWEQKTGTPGAKINCESVNCADPHHVNNSYQWSINLSNPDGGAFVDFLAKLNDSTRTEADEDTDVTGCLGGQCDWRLPNITEVQTIVDCSFGSPCLDPIFGGAGQVALTPYWTTTRFLGDPFAVWVLHAVTGLTDHWGMLFQNYARAVRVGSCN